ncbi:MAG: cyclic nucleotide-binding domain-containing protein [Fuerstiella sp.]|nr:cyclic nucleotide-binding domain-containing protein [Fuerstiella sp.]
MNVTSDKLSSLHIFDGLTEDEVTAVRHSVVQKSFNAGTQILQEGAGIQALWLILEGECVVSRSRDDGGGGHELARLKPGDVFGEMSFIRSAPHSANIFTVTDVLTCVWKREDYLKLAEQSPHAGFRIASNIAAVLAERIRRMDHWVCELMARPDTQAHRDEWENFRSAVYTNWQF